MSTATFTEIGHRYELDGEVIPSVTQVLTLAGISDVSGIPPHILERAGAIGTAVHQATELLDQDDLELDSLDPLIVGFVTAYQRFKADLNFIPSAIERGGIGQCGEIKFGYRIDRIGAFVNADGYERRVLLDIKTSSRPQPSWAIQTAAYAAAIGHEDERLVVHLSKDGSYKLIWHEDHQDQLVWIAALTVANWKLSHGGKIK